MSKENYLSPDKIEELTTRYLSSNQKEGVMTTHQVWVKKSNKEVNYLIDLFTENQN
jgi:hypothetical protein